MIFQLVRILVSKTKNVGSSPTRLVNVFLRVKIKCIHYTKRKY